MGDAMQAAFVLPKASTPMEMVIWICCFCFRGLGSWPAGRTACTIVCVPVRPIVHVVRVHKQYACREEFLRTPALSGSKVSIGVQLFKEGCEVFLYVHLSLGLSQSVCRIPTKGSTVLSAHLDKSYSPGPEPQIVVSIFSSIIPI